MFQRSLKIIVPTAASVGCCVLDSFCNNSDINDSSIINGNVRYALKQPIFAASWFSWSSPPPDDYTHYNWNSMKKITKQREKDQIKLTEYIATMQKRLFNCRQLPSRALSEKCVNDIRVEVGKESVKITSGSSRTTLKDRQDYVKQYGCTAWTDEALETLKEFSPIVELGAGQGLWAKELMKRYGKEINIVAFDNYSSPVPYFEKTEHVKFGNEDILLDSKYEKHTLFLCFPPLTQDSDLGIKCLNMYKGNFIIYVGEGRRGSNCSEEFFDILEEKFTIKKVVTLKPFHGGAEKMFVLERKKEEQTTAPIAAALK
jgi:hypothetical protein